jgi:hypothetical protein
VEVHLAWTKMGVSDFNFLRILIVSIKSVNPKAKASILCYNFQKKVRYAKRN